MTNKVKSLADIPEFAQCKAIEMLNDVLKDAYDLVSNGLESDFDKVNNLVEHNCVAIRKSFIALYTVESEISEIRVGSVMVNNSNLEKYEWQHATDSIRNSHKGSECLK